ncbi:MAG: sugar phosphate isomerase/epimerase [Spirosomataceae bacterium]
MVTRRSFLQSSASLLGLGLVANELQAKGTLKEFGCQLYSIRDVLPKAPQDYMKQLASMGYRYFESYSKDPFWGMKPAELKTFLADHNARMVSTHAGLPDTNEELVAKAVEAGLKYIICPFIGMQPSKDAWLQKADAFNKNGELCKKYGIQYGYHNHSYSFTFANGALGQKVLIENTDPKLVCFELDMCWSEAAGEDTIAHLHKYADRYQLCHVKQLETKTPKPKQTDLDKGIIDYKKILHEAMKDKMKYYLVEQEEYPVNSIDSMKSNAAYLKDLKF